MAWFPGTYFAPGPNTDGTTSVNKDYMDKRDQEILAIEQALGLNLVPNTSTPLSGYLQVSAGGNLLLAQQPTQKVLIGTSAPFNSLTKMQVSGGNFVVSSDQTRILDINRSNPIGGYVWQVFRESGNEKWWFATETSTQTPPPLGTWKLDVRCTAYPYDNPNYAIRFRITQEG